VESLKAPGAAEVSEAIVVWTGWAEVSWPARDQRRLADRFGRDRALELLPLLPLLRILEDEFYDSDARFTVANLKEMGDKAAARCAHLHPELTAEAIEAFVLQLRLQVGVGLNE
jgi:hypothetical protein